MRQKNEKFANNVRAGKQAVQPSVREKLQKRSPVGYTALVVLGFVLVGGGEWPAVSSISICCVLIQKLQVSCKYLACFSDEPLSTSSFLVLFSLGASHLYITSFLFHSRHGHPVEWALLQGNHTDSRYIVVMNEYSFITTFTMHNRNRERNAKLGL